MTRTILILGLGLVGLSGCRNIAGPLEARDKPKADLPWLSIEEQQRRGRDKYAIPEDDPRIGPSLGIDRPSPIGR